MDFDRVLGWILGDNLQTASLRMVIIGVAISVVGGAVLWLIG